MLNGSAKTGYPHRIGIIGYGYIGQALVSRIRADSDRFDIAFVHARRREQASDISNADFLGDLNQMKARGADLVVETAHPSITKLHGADILTFADYMPLSTSALSDDTLLQKLSEIALAHDTRLLLASGALIGGEEIRKRTKPWARARITFRKHPKNIDFSDAEFSADNITKATTVFQGKVRDIADQYPRNVNTMITAALLSTGLDACEAILVADPNLNCAIAEFEAWGTDGSYVRTEKKQPAKGVSGTEMTDSVWYSIRQTLGVSDDFLQLV